MNLATTFINPSRNVRIALNVNDEYNALKQAVDNGDFVSESATRLAEFLLNKHAVTERSAVSRKRIAVHFFGPTYSTVIRRLTVASTSATPSDRTRLLIVDLKKDLLDMQLKVRGAAVHLSKELKQYGCFLRCFRGVDREPMYCIALCPDSVTRAISVNNANLQKARRNNRILQNLRDKV